MKITNIKVGVDFNNLLSTHPVFSGGDNYKMIAPAEYLLSRIHQKCVFYKTEYTEMNHEYIKNIFQQYTGRYAIILEALAELELLEYLESNTGGKSYEVGKNSASYRVTPKCVKLLESSNKENLRLIHNDPIIRKRLSGLRRKRISRLQDTGDRPVDNLNRLLLNLKYDYEKVKQLQQDPLLTDKQRDNIDYSLININTFNYWIERTEKDGRIHSPWVLMKSDLRKYMSIIKDSKTYKYNYTIDIRSCHPLYLSYFILSSYYNTTSLYTTLEGVNVTPQLIEDGTLYHRIEHKHLINEHKKWISYWSDEVDDIRTALGEGLNLDEDKDAAKDKAKDLINKAVNDKNGRNYNILTNWIQLEFPLLYNIWSKTDITTTGCNISKLIESQIIRSEELYSFIETIDDVVVADEHDGLGVFSLHDDSEINSKLDRIRKKIQQISVDKFGIRPMVKVEDVHTGGIVN